MRITIWTVNALPGSSTIRLRISAKLPFAKWRMPTPAILHSRMHSLISYLGFSVEMRGLGSLPLSPKPKLLCGGLIAPHIDLRVGGPTYAWAYKEIAERCDADLFILLGTSHYGMNDLFVSTLKDYNTPLGPVTTDQAFVRALQDNYSENLFADEILHRNEHSLEFQMLFLQYVLGEKRDFSVVPILVSSFHHMVIAKTPPAEIPRMADFLTALKKTIADSRRKVCFVAGVDFAHVGQKFGDQGDLTQDFLDWVEAEDKRLIHALEKVDHNDFFEQIAKDGDKRRVCGFSPMYTMLNLLEAKEGKLLKYDRSIDQQTQSSVSFASLAFY